MARTLNALRRNRSRARSGLACAFLIALIGPVVVSLEFPESAAAANGTHVSGTISTNTTWTLAGSPYVLDGNITVSSGVTLTIEPGVVVKFNGTSRQLTVNGTLSAVGTPGSRITFTSIQDDSVGGDSGGDGPTSGAPGQWYTIQVKASGSQLKFADVRHGGWGSSNTGYGAVLVSGGAAHVTIEDSTLSDNQRAALKVQSAGGATVRRTTIERNAVGASVIGAWLKLEDRSIVRSNSSDGLWFSYVSTYTGTASSITDSDIASNGGDGIEIGADQDLPATYWPHGNRNNVYANTSKQLKSRYTKRDGVDWTMNYFGDGVDYAFNASACFGNGKDSRGHLAYLASTADPPDGPVSWFYYFDPSNTIKCAYDDFNIGPSQFYRTYITADTPPPAMSFTSCQGGLHATTPTVCASDPVRTVSGSFDHEKTDLSLPGIGLPFAWTRSYHSQDLTAGPLGTGWTHSYAAALTIKANGDVTLRGEDGQQVEYVKQADGSYLGASGALSRLTKTGSTYELLRQDQVKYAFDASGRLTSMRDRNNQGLTLAYDGSGRLQTITDSVGRAITVTHDANGNLSQVALPDGRNVTYGYTSGRLTSVTDARGRVWTYAYHATYGWLKKEVDPLQHSVFDNTYSKWGRVTEQLDALNNKTTFAWDAATQTATVTDARLNAWKDVYTGGKLVKRIDPLGNTWEYGYDTNYNLTSVKDARGKTTTMTYDSRGNLLTRTAPAPLSYLEEFTYDAKNNLLTAKNARGYTTSYGYDAAGNLTSVTQPGNVVTQIARDPAGTGLVKSITDPRGKTTQFQHDSSGNVTAVITPLGNKTTFAHDGSGRVTSRVEPRGNVTGANPDDYRTSFTYNGADQLLTATDPLGNQTVWTYDDAGNQASMRDAKLRTTSYGYDAANRLTSVTAPDTTVTSYGYDAVGNRTTRTDAKNHTATFAYDAANRLTSVVGPLSRTWTHEYDGNGNRTKTVDANGNATTGDPNDGTTTYDFDELNRLTAINYSDTTQDVTFAYDGNGNRTSMTDAGTQTSTYDSLDRLSGVTRGTDSFSYLYDDADNVTRRTYPGGRVIDYTYDDDGRPATVASNGQTTSYGYDVAGNLTSATLPAGNGYVETRTYDRAGRLSEVRNAKGGSSLSFATYGLDAVGSPTTATTQEGTATYTYDSRDRLEEVCYQASCPGASDPFVRWTYDAVGNRLTEARPAGTTTYAYNDADELTSASGPGGSVSYAFDQNGNQTQAGSRTFAYDLANRLKSTTLASTTTSYTYDGTGVRLQAASGANVVNYLWDINNPLPQLALERDGSGGVLRNYLRGTRMVSMDAGGSTSYLHYDGLGSVTNLTSPTGGSQWKYSYEPFGSVRTETQDDPGAPANVLRFAGELRDSDTGLYHLRARQYDPATARFLTTDPLAPKLSEPYPSTYVYANNRPTALIDPSGMGQVWASDPPPKSFTDRLAHLGAAIYLTADSAIMFGAAGAIGYGCAQATGLSGGALILLWGTACAPPMGAATTAGVFSAHEAYNQWKEAFGD